MNRQLKLVIAGLVLAALPLVLFIGFESRTRVNGAEVLHDRVNIAGIVLGLVALSLAWSIAMRWETEADRAPKWKAAAAIVGVAAIAQVVHSVGVF